MNPTVREAVRALAAAPAANGERLTFSKALRAALAGAGERVSLGELVDALHDRAFGALLLISALPNASPLALPGTSAVTSIPMCVVGYQLIMGWNELHVPAFVRRWTLPTRQFGLVMDKIAPWLEWAERLARPRLPALVSRPVERLIGIVCIVLAIVLFLPIPLGNMPPGISVCLLGLGLMEKDGRTVALGLIASAISLVIAISVVLGAYEIVVYAFTYLFGR